MHINLIADTSVGSAPAGFTAAVQAAASDFDKEIPGNYTVNITYGWGTYDNVADSELSPSSHALSIGGPSANYLESYSTVKRWLTAAAVTAQQITAVASLPATSPVGNNFFVSTSLEKAFGVFSGDASAVDGSIGFNTADDAGGVLSPYIQEGALTEIAHALGLESGLGTSNYANVLDLFRFAAPGTYYSDNGQPSYFSIDGGRTDIANYSTGSTNGVTDPTLFENIVDPLAIPLTDGGAQKSLTSLDTEVLTVLGFSGNSNLFGAITHDATSPAGQVEALYQTILGRSADGAGLRGYSDQVSSGTPITTIAQDMLGSGEYANDYGASTQSNSGFVTQLYRDGLHREPDAQGLATYDNALASGVSRAQVAVDIATSAESRNDLAPIFQAGVLIPDETDTGIAQLYYGLLDRAPDGTGLASWEIDVGRGGSLLDVASGFIGSSEYAAVHGPQTNTQFVAALYQGALGRQPDADGANHYLGELNGGTSRASVALDIAESSEAKAHLAPLIQGNYNLA